LTSFSNSNSLNEAMLLFVETPFVADKQLIFRACAAEVCWHKKEFDKCIYVTVFVIFSTLFSNSVRQSVSSCTGRYEKPCNIALLIYFLAYKSLLFIMSDVLKHNKAQKSIL